MATTATATLLRGPFAVAGTRQAIFTVASDTTDASGQMTLDLTDWFTKVDAIQFGGITSGGGYFLEIEKPVPTTAITASNVKIGVYEAGADAAPLDPVASTDMSTILAGLTIVVHGTGTTTT